MIWSLIVLSFACGVYVQASEYTFTVVDIPAGSSNDKKVSKSCNKAPNQGQDIKLWPSLKRLQAKAVDASTSILCLAAVGDISIADGGIGKNYVDLDCVDSIKCGITIIDNVSPKDVFISATFSDIPSGTSKGEIAEQKTNCKGNGVKGGDILWFDGQRADVKTDSGTITCYSLSGAASLVEGGKDKNHIIMDCNDIMMGCRLDVYINEEAAVRSAATNVRLMTGLVSLSLVLLTKLFM